MGYWTKYNEKKKKWRQRELANNPDAVQCLICGKKFIQVGSHIVQAHQMTAREYRQEYGLDVKKGLIKGEYRERKSQSAYDNGMDKKLTEWGAKTRFKEGQKIYYQRSEQTLERLKLLGKVKKGHKFDI